jgi:hypothetical protein
MLPVCQQTRFRLPAVLEHVPLQLTKSANELLSRYPWKPCLFRGRLKTHLPQGEFIAVRSGAGERQRKGAHR